VPSIFDGFSPVVEYVDLINDNPRDASKVTYKFEGDTTNLIKWCRRNFGSRGDGWDYTGNFRKVEITVWNTKLITMYELWKN